MQSIILELPKEDSQNATSDNYESSNEDVLDVTDNIEIETQSDSFDSSSARKRMKFTDYGDFDDAELFVMSLLKPLKKIPEEEQLQVRTELLNVLIRAQERVKNKVKTENDVDL